MAHTGTRAWRIVDTMLSLVLLAMLITMNFSQVAYALDTEKCTARPNGDTGSTVLGGVETRITWEGQAAEDESLRSITLTMPEGTEFSVDDARLTVLTGADKLTWVGTALLTVIIIIFGETIPKICAKKGANRVSLRFAYPIRALTILLRPIVWLVVKLVWLLTFWIKADEDESGDEAVEELQSIIETAEDEEVLDGAAALRDRLLRNLRAGRHDRPRRRGRHRH